MTIRAADYRLYLRQRPVILSLLSLLAISFFLMVTGLSKAYHAQRESLGDRWSSRGAADLGAKRFDAAVTDFRAALLYSPDNYDYQLNLAEALIGLKRTGEASAYLLNLWDRQPQDGLVNLELARIAAQRNQTDQAIRYYNGAVYAAWNPQQEFHRRSARVELIELLLATNAKSQALAELMALEKNQGKDPSQPEQLGDLFLRAEDYGHALEAFRDTLRTEPRNSEALAGAGRAAFALGQYAMAQHYLQEAVNANAQDQQSQQQLETAEMVLKMDPFRPQMPAAERHRAVLEAFTVAGERLKNCAATIGSHDLSGEWTNLNPRVTERGLQRDPNLIEAAMDLVFRIERETSASCGPPTGKDLALLLISKSHEANP